MQIKSILLEDCSKGGDALLFSAPKNVIIASDFSQIDAALAELNDAQQGGQYVAGFASYEFGLCNEELTKSFANGDFPLLCFGVFNAPRQLKSQAIGRYLRRKNRGAGFDIRNISYSKDFTQYQQAFDNIRENIQKGHIYQANLTFKINGEFSGSPLALYEKLRTRQNAKYCAYIETDCGEILSLSPELFFTKTGDIIETHPMKGTISRDIPKAQEALRNDEKQRAENLMITDLMRNDFAKVSLAGSVKVPNLFAIEEYPTLLQMISKITAKAKPQYSTLEILKQIAPAGSITGCPKIRAEELIFANEGVPRGIYCGNIGYIAPNGDAQFNVAIRTASLQNGKLEMGIGSGVVYDSDAQKEYDECLLKARFLTDINRDFAIFETLKWENGEYKRLEMHLARLKNAARHFGFAVDWAHLDEMLENCAENIAWDQARIRILIEEDSQEVGTWPFEDAKETWKIAISPTIMQSDNPNLYYKTNRREIYDSEWADFNAKGIDEVLYCNERGELTEGSRSNIFLDFGDGILATPPQQCGLLNGILRQELLESGTAIEKILRPEDLQNAKAIYVGNSLRGIKRCEYED